MREITALSAAAGLASWDQMTMMPPRATDVRALLMSAISGVVHDKALDPDLGIWLKELAANPVGLTAAEQACVREWLRDHELSIKLPPDLVRELARVTTLSHKAWDKARHTSDFSLFAPWLEKIVRLKRRGAECLGYAQVPYDALLDIFEPGTTVATLDPIMQSVREGLVPIVAAIVDARHQLDERPLRHRFPEAAQEALCREVMAKAGLDPEASRLDRSAHPFCLGLAPTDARITARYSETSLPQALYSVIHEMGHALYEQGLPEKDYGSPMCEAVSFGMHESQSRLWENFIGRSEPFARFLLPRLRKHFPPQMRGVNTGKLYRALNSVHRSAIRVEADEVTYNLHVVLRYELEKSLINGDTRVRDLPHLWNEAMQKLLGLKPKNDAEGVLQDTHWAQGMIGYFPTYALGNLYAAQLWQALQKKIPGIETKIARGDFKPILAWLRQNIHRHGRRYKPLELLKRATGHPLDARHFLEYLKVKFGKLYGIKEW
jgi:carboxypeptidase Taq